MFNNDFILLSKTPPDLLMLPVLVGEYGKESGYSKLKVNG